MELSQENLETIGSYVRKNLRNWLGETFSESYLQRDLELRDRMIRVEEELKTQRELMKQGFEQIELRFQQVDKRFEQVDKRFETHFDQVNKRFDDMQHHMNRWMTVLTTIVGIIGLFAALTNLIG